MLSQAQGWTDDKGAQPFTLPRRALPKDAESLAPVLEREQKPLRPGAGKLEAVVPTCTLKQKLGATTYRLWAVLLTMRDDTGETHPSLRGLAKAAGMSEPQAAKSLARLRQFKLVEDYGFMHRHVPCSCKDGCWGHPVYIRDVYGLIKQEDAQAFVARVPRETVRLVMAAAGQGGARKGAGRPRKVDAPAAEKASVAAEKEVAENKANKSKGGAYKNQELVSQKNLTVLLQTTPLHGESVLTSRKAGKDTQTTQEALTRFLSSPPSAFAASPLQTKAPSARSDSAPAMTSAAPAAPGPLAEQASAVSFENSNAPGKSENMNTSDVTDSAQVIIDGVAHSGLDAIFAAGDAREIGLSGTPGPRQKFTPDDLRATTAISNAITILRVPLPAKVNASMDEEARLALLKLAFRAAHEKTFRCDYWRPAKAQSFKERTLLLEAAQALEAANLAPVAWARFLMIQWTKLGKRTAPTVQWVWNAARITEQAGWCKEAIGPLDGGSAETMPATKELYLRLGKIQRQLGWGRPTEVVVSEVLPDAERTALLRQQALQAEAWKKDIAQRIRNGEWVWG